MNDNTNHSHTFTILNKKFELTIQEFADSIFILASCLPHSQIGYVTEIKPDMDAVSAYIEDSDLSLPNSMKLYAEVEPLIGPRDDPLISLVTQHIAQSYTKFKDNRQITLALGLPLAHQINLSVLERKLFIKEITDNIIYYLKL